MKSILLASDSLLLRMAMSNASLQEQVLAVTNALLKAESQSSSPHLRRELHATSQGYVLTLSTDTAVYQLQFGAEIPTESAMRTTRVLRSATTNTIEEFVGLEFLDAPVPDEFKELHLLLVQELNRILPPNIRGQLNSWLHAVTDTLQTAKAATTSFVQKHSPAVKASVADTASAISKAITPSAERPAASAPVDSPAELSEGASAPIADLSPDSELGKLMAKTMGRATKGEVPIVLHRDNQQNLHFYGQVLAQVAAPPVRGRGLVLAVYRTRGGKHIGQRVGYSLIPGESFRSEVMVADNLLELQSFFGYSGLAKALYQVLDLNDCEFIE